MGHWPTVMRAIKDADVVLFVLDARMPELSRNKDLEEKLEKSGKEILLVFNKIDLVSGESLKNLKEKYHEAFFVSGGENKNVNRLRIELFKIGKKLGFEKLEVGIVGYPNVGKSAITNALSRAGKSKVSAKAGTTIGLQWASSSRFKILDSPGVIPFEDDEVKLGILGAKNPEKLKDAEAVAVGIIKIFLDNNIKKLEETYGFSVEGDEYDILMKIGEEKKLLKKGGVVDDARVSLMIVRDWQKGKLRL